MAWQIPTFPTQDCKQTNGKCCFPGRVQAVAEHSAEMSLASVFSYWLPRWRAHFLGGWQHIGKVLVCDARKQPGEASCCMPLSNRCSKPWRNCKACAAWGPERTLKQDGLSPQAISPIAAQKIQKATCTKCYETRRCTLLQETKYEGCRQSWRYMHA